MMQRTDIAALVLAAGCSSRMEKFKPLLPVGQTTALERCIRLFQGAGIRDVRVVVGHGASELQPIIESLGVRSVMNYRFAEGMFSSIQAGVRDLDCSTKAFFLLPVDIPLVRRTTIQDLAAVFAGVPASVCIPSFLGRRGHPPLISTKWGTEILSWKGDGGLRALLSQHSCRPWEVPVADEHILMDMDTPEDYEKILAAIPDYDAPSAEECMVLLTAKFSVPRHIVAHSSKVAQVALHLAKALNGRGCMLDLKLIVAAGLLHDLAKGRPNHATVAAEALTELGYPAVADVVKSHMNAQPLSHLPISAQDVVCFADKLVKEDRIVSLETRFRGSFATFGDDSLVAEKVVQRFSAILRTRERLQETLGSSIEDVLSAAFSCHGENRYGDLSPKAR